jgi:hypothetical protein
MPVEGLRINFSSRDLKLLSSVGTGTSPILIVPQTALVLEICRKKIHVLGVRGITVINVSREVRSAMLSKRKSFSSKYRNSENPSILGARWSPCKFGLNIFEQS